MRKLRRSIRFFQRPQDVGKANFRTLIAIRYPVTVQSFNHSYNSIQSFKYSVFHPTVLKPQGHGAIFTCDCNNLLKTCLFLKNIFVAVVRENNSKSQSFILVIFIELSKNQRIMLLQCLYQSY